MSLDPAVSPAVSPAVVDLTDAAARRRQDELRQLATAQAALVREFADLLAAEQVEQQFRAIVSRFDEAPIRSFVPLLAQRIGREELRRTLTGAG